MALSNNETIFGGFLLNDRIWIRSRYVMLIFNQILSYSN